MEFLARFGTGFLSAYHRVWADSPSGLALGAFTHDGQMVGVILASLDPPSHYRWMLTHGGAALAGRMVLAAGRRPALARDLIVTRGLRYSRALWRQLTKKAVAAVPTVEPRRGEITHLMVGPAARGTGAGRALVAETERRAAAAGVAEIELVTPPDFEAREFYQHLGWVETGTVVSRSGEEFVRFRRPLAPDDSRDR